MSNKRIEFIDLAKGFCIILVLIHHLESGLNIHFDIDPYLRTFRMPLYFLLSGLFFKTYENFVGFEIRKINKLLIPFLFFYLFTSVLFTWGLQIMGNEEINWELPIYFITNEECVSNRPIWFLWCLFIVNTLFYIIYLVSNSLSNYKILFLTIISFILGVCGFYLGYYNINLLAFIDTSLTALPFFSLGFILRKYTRLLVANKWDRYNLVFAFICMIIVYLLTSGEVNYRTNNYSMPLYAVYLSGFLGTLGILFLSKTIRRLPIISYLGRYSIIVLVTHQILMIPFIWVFNHTTISKNLVFFVITILMILSYLIVIPFMKKYFPYVTAQKDLFRVPKQ